MILRIFVTLVMFVLAVFAFWSGAFGEGHFFNPFGILFLVLMVVIWFNWEIIRDAFRTARGKEQQEAKNESTLPITRLGFNIIEGMRRPQRTKRRSDEPS